ncbi:MAG TPA: MATE family efflux transporter [Verrucomicrobia bacterium]|nr:MATE family efflux transporter [Verrucomicrobiota bacterium]HOP96758.1 MATE family efflux transporter [Verrucomicrobiota bacterium]
MTRRFRLWRREARPTLALAFPIMGGMLSQMLMGLADTIMVGRVGVVPLAACSLVNAVAHLPLVFGFGLLSAIAVLTAQAYGARRPDDAAQVLRHGLLMSVLMGLAAALSLIGVRPWLAVLRQPPEVVEAADTYLILFAASMFPALVAHGMKQFSEALKHPWAPTVVLLGGVGLNVLLNWVLIYGHWGAPAMGLDGAGWATLLARSGMALAMLGYVLVAAPLRAYRPARWSGRLEWQRLRGLLALGVPVALQHLLEVSAFVFAALMMGWIGSEAIAAHQIAMTCAATTFMFPLGIGMAVCIRVGHAYGAAQFSRMRRIGFGGVGMAAAIMAVSGVLFMTAGRPIAGLFITAPEVLNLAAQLLIVAAIFQIADGVQVVAISALRGLNDVRHPAAIAGLAYWVLALPVGSLLAFRFGLGAMGIWIGLAAGLGVAAAGLSWRFHAKTGWAACHWVRMTNKCSPSADQDGTLAPLLPEKPGTQA